MVLLCLWELHVIHTCLYLLSKWPLLLFVRRKHIDNLVDLATETINITKQLTNLSPAASTSHYHHIWNKQLEEQPALPLHSPPRCASLHCKGGIVTIEGWQIANFPSTLLLYHKLGNKTVVVLTLFQCACWVNLLPLYPACLLHFSGDTKHGYICVWMWSNWGQTDYRTWWQQCFPDSKHTWINEPQLMIAIIRFDFLSLPFCMKCGWG